MTLQAAFERMAVPTRVMSAIEISAVAERYIRRRALRHMEKGRIVIFACGTGNPFFSTDTAGALRAKELEADVLLKATNVDGIYTADPRKNPDARRYEHITFREVLDQGLRVMDTAAFAMCHEDGLPIIVFDLHRDGNIRRVVLGEHIGTVVSLQAPASSSHSTQEPSHV
jgi:uridylate kinase